MSRAANTNAIVGGGLLGLTLAHRLAQRGEKVVVFESADRLGGLADAWTLGDVVWDRHYHVTLLSDLALRGLLAELGLEQEMQWVTTRTGFFTDGRMHSMSDTVEFLKFPPLGLLDKFRLGGTIFYASKIRDGRRLEKIPVGDWLRRWSGRRAFEKIWLPLLRAKLGENWQHVSASFIWATIARMYAARRSGLKREMFGYVPGGYARILERFAAKLEDEGVEIRTRAGVRRVAPDADGGAVVECDGKAPERFGRVVLTVPAPVASRLCPELPEDVHARLNGIRYQGIVCASLLLKRPVSGYYVTNITDDWVPFTAVIETTALVDPARFGGRTLVYLPKYVPPDDPIFDESDESVRARFVAALLRMHPHLSEEDVLAFRVSRVRHVVALSTLDYTDNLPPMTTGLPGVYVVNSAHIVNGTLNVNETVRLAEEAAADVLPPHADGTVVPLAGGAGRHEPADRQPVA